MHAPALEAQTGCQKTDGSTYRYLTRKLHIVLLKSPWKALVINNIPSKHCSVETAVQLDSNENPRTASFVKKCIIQILNSHLVVGLIRHT